MFSKDYKKKSKKRRSRSMSPSKTAASDPDLMDATESELQPNVEHIALVKTEAAKIIKAKAKQQMPVLTIQDEEEMKAAEVKGPVPKISPPGCCSLM